MSKYTKDHVFDKRNVDKVLTRDQIKGIQILTMTKSPDNDGFRTYGSLSYQSQTYPSDIDGSQSFTFCKKYGCKTKDALYMVQNILQQSVKNILSTKGAYLGDIKVGVDDEIHYIIYDIQEIAYKDHIDPLWQKYLKDNKLKDFYNVSPETKISEDQISQLLIHDYSVTFPKDKTLSIWKGAYDKGIISKESLDTIQELIPYKLKGKQGIHKFFEYCEFVRDLYTFRWTGQEILVGFKMLGNRKITLLNAIDSAAGYDCLYDEFKDKDNYCINSKTKKKRHPDFYGSLIKVDMFAITNGKISEFSNLYSFISNEKDIKNIKLSYGESKTNIDINQDPKQLENDLLNDIALYYNEVTKKYTKPMKFAKRMFVVSLIRNDKNVGLKLAKLFKSDINLLNHINSEIGIVLDMLSTQDNPPMDVLFNQLDNLKFEASKIIQFNIDTDAFYDLIDRIISGKLTRNEIIDILDQLKEFLSSIIDEQVKKYLKSQKLWPGPYYDKNKFEFIYG